ncbi:MAG: hypothetical protein ACIRZF_09115 [Ligilactobacillus ruminis]
MHKVISFWPKRLKNRNRQPANAPKTAKKPQNRLLPKPRRPGAARQAVEPYKKKNSNDSENHWNFNVIDCSHPQNRKKEDVHAANATSWLIRGRKLDFLSFWSAALKDRKSSILCTGAGTGHGHVLNEDGERFFCTVDSMRRHK